MKRHLRAAFAAAVLLQLAAASGAAETLWYRSDALGLPIERISVQAPTAEGYSLKVDRQGSDETRSLYQAGDRIERTVRSFDSKGRLAAETVYRKDLLSRKTSFTAAGRPASEIYYVNGAPRQQIEYTYDDRGRPAEAVTYRYTTDADTGKPVREASPAWTDTFVYNPGGSTSSGVGPPVTGSSAAGSISEVRRLYADGTRRISRFDYSGTRLTEEWVGTDTDGVLTRYDARGLRTLHVTYRDNKPVSRESFVYRSEKEGGAQVLVSSTSTSLTDGTATVNNYRNGRVVKSVESKDGKVTSTTEYQYDGDRIAQKTVEQEGTSERWDYSYAADTNKLERQAYSIDGTLVEVIHYGNDNSSVHERYRNGSVVLRTYYHGEQRVKEELVRDGRVIRTLEF
jgi:antitoxin component YwqK of YwqJK toxin-antitoxin module